VPFGNLFSRNDFLAKLVRVIDTDVFIIQDFIKMKRIYLSLIISFTFLLLGCQKEEPKGGNSPGYPNISGYTATDNNGNLMGLIDESDWIYDSNWSIGVENLFPEFQNLVNDFGHYSTIQMYPGYPNPTSSASYFSMIKDNDIRVSFRVVNKYHQVIASADSMYSSTFGVNTPAIVSSTDTLIRIYYFFERNDSCLYKGHGDIKVN